MIEYTCDKCGKTFTLKNVRKRVFCPCGQVQHNPAWKGSAVSLPIYEWPCTFRGEVIGELDCKCQGRPSIYTCEIKGKCALRCLSGKSHKDDITFCNACGDRSMYRNAAIGFMSSVYSEFGGVESWTDLLIHELGAHHFSGMATSEDYRGKPCIPIYSGREALEHLALAAKNILVWGCTEDAAEVSKIPGIGKMIAVHHGSVNSLWAKSVFERQLEFCHDAIAVNRQVAQHYGVKYLPNMIAPSRAEPSGIISHRKEPGGKVVLWNHRFAPEKRPELAVEISELLPDGWQLWMTSRGLQANTPKLVDIGAVGHPGAYLAMSDVFLSTTTQEAFGHSVAEAVLAKVPVVSSAYGIAADGYATELVESDDPHVWVEAILRAESAKCLDEKRDRIMAEYGAATVVPQWKTILVE